MSGYNGNAKAFGVPKGPQQPTEPAKIPPVQRFIVTLPNGNTEEVTAHMPQLERGHLSFVRAGYVDESCTTQAIIPVRMFAPGEWRAVKCEWTGYKKSEFALH